jgi:hypothetical protein
MKLKLLIIALSLTLQANSLTKQQHTKLSSSIVKVSNNIFTIEEYNSINFTKKIFFDGQSIDKVIVKTKATMQKDIIHKEQFIAISSTLSEQIMQSIFMNPQYFETIQSIDLLVNNPKNINLTININFKKDGLDTTVTNGKLEQKRFISYDQLFHQRLK